MQRDDKDEAEISAPGSWAGVGLLIIFLATYVFKIFPPRSEREEEKPIALPRLNGFFSKSSHAEELKRIGYGAPENACCPIEKDIMTESVILGDGYTYEKTNIEQWLGKSDKAPVMGERLSGEKLRLTPNVTKAIENDQLVFKAKLRYVFENKTTLDVNKEELDFSSLAPPRFNRSQSC